MRNLAAPWRVIAMHTALNTLFFVPVMTAYYSQKGADNGTFLLLQGLFRVTVLLLEIPTGYLADQWDRRTQLSLAAAIWLAGHSILLGTSTFWGLLAFECAMALSCALRSGTLEAYLHETLRTHNRLHEQGVWQTRIVMGAMAGQALASFVGAWLYALHAELPVMATMVVAGLGLILSLRLPTAGRATAPQHSGSHLSRLWKVVHHSLRTHPHLPWLLLGPWPLFGLTGMLFWIMQMQLKTAGVPVVYTGFAVAAYQATMVGLTLRVHSLLAYLPPRRFVALLPVLLVVGTGLLLTSSPVLIWVGGVVGAGVVHTLGRPVSTTLINEETTDHERATVLSVGSMITQMLGALLLVASQPLLEVVGLQTLLLGALALTLLLAGYPLWRLSRV